MANVDNDLKLEGYVATGGDLAEAEARIDADAFVEYTEGNLISRKRGPPSFANARKKIKQKTQNKIPRAVPLPRLAPP